MAYGLSPRVSLDLVPPGQVSPGCPNDAMARPWGGLSDTCRFDLVERALRAADDRIEAFALAI